MRENLIVRKLKAIHLQELPKVSIKNLTADIFLKQVHECFVSLVIFYDLIQEIHDIMFRIFKPCFTLNFFEEKITNAGKLSVNRPF